LETLAVTSIDTLEALLTPDALTALMRSTWTWDDRALRRDLAVLLVEIEAAHAAADGDAPDHAETLRGRSLASGADFVAAVLGPHLIADAGNALRRDYLAYALDGAAFKRGAATSLARVREGAGAYAQRHSHIDYPSQSDWLPLISKEGAAGLASAMRAFGHALSDSNFFGNAALTWQALQAVGDADAAKYAKAIESGAITATMAVAEKSGSWDPALVRTKAVPVQDGWRLSGAKLFVPAAGGADVYFVIGRSIAGPSLFAVERAAPGLQLSPLDVVDSTRPLHRVEFADTPAKLVSAEGHGGRLMMTVLDLATTALAAEQVGVIEKAMGLLAAAGSTDAEFSEVTLGHVVAFSLWRRALDAQADASSDASPLAAAAHVGCSRAAVRAATITAQLLGPSEETDALLRRAQSANLLFGGPALSHERLLERLGV
jgi:alkylation response protein AidB-like acyl-CoA dehydrogenase